VAREVVGAGKLVGIYQPDDMPGIERAEKSFWVLVLFHVLPEHYLRVLSLTIDSLSKRISRILNSAN